MRNIIALKQLSLVGVNEVFLVHRGVTQVLNKVKRLRKIRKQKSDQVPFSFQNGTLTVEIQNLDLMGGKGLVFVAFQGNDDQNPQVLTPARVRKVGIEVI